MLGSNDIKRAVKSAKVDCANPASSTSSSAALTNTPAHTWLGSESEIKKNQAFLAEKAHASLNPSLFFAEQIQQGLGLLQNLPNNPNSPKNQEARALTCKRLRTPVYETAIREEISRQEQHLVKVLLAEPLDINVLNNTVNNLKMLSQPFADTDIHNADGRLLQAALSSFQWQRNRSVSHEALSETTASLHETWRLGIEVLLRHYPMPSYNTKAGKTIWQLGINACDPNVFWLLYDAVYANEKTRLTCAHLDDLLEITAADAKFLTLMPVLLKARCELADYSAVPPPDRLTFSMENHVSSIAGPHSPWLSWGKYKLSVVDAALQALPAIFKQHKDTARGILTKPVFKNRIAAWVVNELTKPGWDDETHLSRRTKFLQWLTGSQGPLTDECLIDIVRQFADANKHELFNALWQWSQNSSPGAFAPNNLKKIRIGRVQLVIQAILQKNWHEAAQQGMWSEAQLTLEAWVSALLPDQSISQFVGIESLFEAIAEALQQAHQHIAADLDRRLTFPHDPSDRYALLRLGVEKENIEQENIERENIKPRAERVLPELWRAISALDFAERLAFFKHAELARIVDEDVFQCLLRYGKARDAAQLLASPSVFTDEDIDCAVVHAVEKQQVNEAMHLISSGRLTRRGVKTFFKTLQVKDALGLQTTTASLIDAVLAHTLPERLQARNAWQQTLLHWMLEQESPWLLAIERWLQINAPSRSLINPRDIEGITPFQLALRKHLWDVLLLLLTHPDFNPTGLDTQAVNEQKTKAALPAKFNEAWQSHLLASTFSRLEVEAGHSIEKSTVEPTVDFQQYLGYLLEDHQHNPLALLKTLIDKPDIVKISQVDIKSVVVLEEFLALIEKVLRGDYSLSQHLSMLSAQHARVKSAQNDSPEQTSEKKAQAQEQLILNFIQRALSEQSRFILPEIAPGPKKTKLDANAHSASASTIKMTLNEVVKMAVEHASQHPRQPHKIAMANHLQNWRTAMVQAKLLNDMPSDFEARWQPKLFES